MVYTALQNNLPELVPAAEQHAVGITKTGLNRMFESAESTLANRSSLRKWGGLSSRGGIRTCRRFSGKEPHSLYSWGQTGDNFGQREVLNPGFNHLLKSNNQSRYWGNVPNENVTRLSCFPRMFLSVQRDLFDFIHLSIGNFQPAAY